MKAPKAAKGENGLENGSSSSKKDYGQKTALGESVVCHAQGLGNPPVPTGK